MRSTVRLKFAVRAVLALYGGCKYGTEGSVRYTIRCRSPTLVSNVIVKMYCRPSEDPNPDVIWEPHPAFEYLEIVCVIWFTFEYVLRFTAASDRLKFFIGLLNIVDLIAILPFYLELVLRLFGFDVSSLQDIKGTYVRTWGLLLSQFDCSHLTMRRRHVCDNTVPELTNTFDMLRLFM